jgi:hypothetical protein
LGLQDFPGQGTAMVGLLDAFWESKGYLTASEMRQFCNSTVPLARLKQRTFTTSEELEADIEVAHFGQAPIEDATVSWELQSGGITVLSGTLPSRAIPIGNAFPLGSIRASLARFTKAAQCKLLVSISSPDQTFQNDWDLWIYPESIDITPPAAVSVVRTLADALTGLETGNSVVLIPRLQEWKRDAGLGFSSIFWNTAWTRGQLPHTLGILCDPKHPVFAEFPTDTYTDWQWWHLIRHSAAMVLDEFPSTLRPLVQVIDDWFTNRRLGLVFEARAGAGRLIVCSIDLLAAASGQNPVARQFLRSLLKYAGSDELARKDISSIDPSILSALFR